MKITNNTTAGGSNSSNITFLQKNPKLVHLVEKAVVSCKNSNKNSKTPTDTTSSNGNASDDNDNTKLVDKVVEMLRAQNMEYQRKNIEQFRQQVELVLIEKKHIVVSNKKEDKEDAAAGASSDNNNGNTSGGENLGASSNSNTTPRKPRKRKLSDRKAPGSSSKSARGNNNSNNYDDFPPTSSSSFTVTPSPCPTERYSDLGGMSETLQQIRELIEYPLLRPEVFRHLGIIPPRGLLLRGPPGTGKSHLANAIAGQLHAFGVKYFKANAPELVSGMSGESEARIRDLFQSAANCAPSIIFLDEIDAIAPKRSGDGSGRGMEKRMVAQLLTSMDCQLSPQNCYKGNAVVVVAATNRPDALDSALRRAGRFDKEILLGVPDEQARQSILKTILLGVRVSGDFDYKQIAKKTPGYVGADIRSLIKEAAVLAMNRIFTNELAHKTTLTTTTTTTMTTPTTTTTDDENNKSASATTPATATTPASSSQQQQQQVLPLTPLTAEELEPLFVTMEDFLAAIPLVQPSGKREGFAVKPDVSWDDIGALSSVRQELALSVLEPIRNPEKFHQLGLSLPAGVLLYGPPGCGKTLLAKAIANESGTNFISVKGPELLDKYVGESERAVRQVFERARSSSPCIVFFDELDSLCPKRGSEGGGNGSSSGVSERVVNQLLTEMDGLESRRSVFVIAATNRPELIDPAMMRPGRLDKLLYVPLPSAEDRVSILQALSTKIKFAPDVKLDIIGKSPRANGYSGADCAALLREAGLAVLKEDMAASPPATTTATASTTDETSKEEGSSESLQPNSGEDDASNNKKTKEPTGLRIEARHFDYAFDHVLPSVSRKDQARYDKIRQRMARARTRGTATVDENAGGGGGAGAGAGTGGSNNKTDHQDTQGPPSQPAAEAAAGSK